MLPVRQLGERLPRLAELAPRVGERLPRRAPRSSAAVPAPLSRFGAAAGRLRALFGGAASPRERTPRPPGGGPPGPAVLAGLCCACALLLLLGIAAAERVAYRGRVLPGVRLDGVAVAGRPRAAVRGAVAAAAARLERAPLPVRAGQVQLTLRPAGVGVAADERATSAAVLSAGRHGNPVGQLLGPVLRHLHAAQVPWAVRYDRGALAHAVDGWAARVDRAPVEGGLRIEGTSALPVTPRAGSTLDRPGALAAVAATLAHAGGGPVELPLRQTAPRIGAAEVDRVVAQARAVLAGPVTITVGGRELTADPATLAAALRAVPSGGHLGLTLDQGRLRAGMAAQLGQVEQPGRDATFQVAGGRVRIVPSVAGHLVDLGPVTAAILEGRRSARSTLVTVEPRRNTAWARSLGIRGKVSEFTTRHQPGQPRVSNIHRAADLLRGQVVEPGQRFSLNQAIGPRTPARGFVRAPVIDQGEFSQDFGGGVSQLATTTFNAIFFGGYKLVTFQPHSFYISRYPMGREATVSLPAPDLSFVDDTRAGVLIETSYTDSSITVTFYGDNGGRVVRAEGPHVLATHQPTGQPEQIDDPGLPAGEVITEHAFTGYDVEVFRVIETPGQPATRQRFFTRYKSSNPKVIHGTGPPA
jgi:vancomycin resistance protein YoaR